MVRVVMRKFLVGFHNAWIYWTKPRHRRNIKQARQILSKIRTFEHDGQVLTYLKRIDPYVFEELVVQLFIDAGLIGWRSPSYSGDGGMDGKVYYPQFGWCYIQSKRYNKAIRAQHIHDFIALVGKRHGFFVHSGISSGTIREYLRDTRVRMLSGSLLVRIVLHPILLSHILK